MRCRAISLLGVAALLGVLDTGCAPSATSAPPVPPITDEKEVRGVDPCLLLPADQLARWGLRSPGVGGAAAEGPRCEWRGEPGRVLGLTLFSGGGGLATLASNSEPTTSRVRVAGYPALETFTGRGEFCQYDVGVAADQVVIATLDAPTPDSCTVLQSVVPLAAENLPAARS